MDFNEAKTAAKTVLIEFYASWCPHCKRMMPVVEEVRGKLAGKVPVYQYDIDENEAESDEARVETIPTFIVYRDGKEMWRHSGEMSGEALLSKVESYI